MKSGLEKWSLNKLFCGQNKHSGEAIFRTFEQAFHVLTRGLSSVRVRFSDIWCSDWSWIGDNFDKTFFEMLNNKLSDDCIREISTHLDLPHRIYFAHINERFETIIKEKEKRLCIIPSTVGSINFMIFRYMLSMFGSTSTELSVSLRVFCADGPNNGDTKRFVLEIILNCTEFHAKKIYLLNFNFEENEKKDFKTVFAERGIEVIFG